MVPAAPKPDEALAADSLPLWAACAPRGDRKSFSKWRCLQQKTRQLPAGFPAGMSKRSDQKLR
jgi:hypothetical protein